MKPYDVNIVADYIIRRLNADETVDLINLKLQKLVYYLQAWSLGITKERFMDCSFEAWVHGPVCRSLYDRFKSGKTLYSFITTEDMKTPYPEESIDEDDRDFINFILDNYAGFSGVELEAMTHKETPWVEARGNINPMQCCNTVISDETMEEYYGKKWESLQAG